MFSRFEAKSPCAEAPAPSWIGGESPNRMEPLDGHLGRDLGVLSDEGGIRCLDHPQLELEALRVGESQSSRLTFDSSPLWSQPVGPEFQRRFGGDAPDDSVHHPGTRLAPGSAWVLKKCQVGAGAGVFVGVEEVVHGGVVLVDALLDEAQTKYTGIEIDVAQRVPGYRCDVVDPV